MDEKSTIPPTDIVSYRYCIIVYIAINSFITIPYFEFSFNREATDDSHCVSAIVQESLEAVERIEGHEDCKCGVEPTVVVNTCQ